jgi:hypothetical protein
MQEAQQALDRLKSFLTTPPILTSLIEGETLLLYTAATLHTVSAALVVEHQELGHALKLQRPVYFISEILSDPKTRYLQSLEAPLC